MNIFDIKFVKEDKDCISPYTSKLLSFTKTKLRQMYYGPETMQDIKNLGIVLHSDEAVNEHIQASEI